MMNVDRWLAKNAARWTAIELMKGSRSPIEIDELEIEQEEIIERFGRKFGRPRAKLMVSDMKKQLRM